jgi:hypothetical protein
MIEKYFDRVRQSLKTHDYSSALDLYLDIYISFPEFFHETRYRTDPNVRQHILNAANLARKNAGDRFMPARLSSQRISDAIDNFVGLKSQPFQLPFQQPSFFYVPNLETKAFYEPFEIVGLEDLLTELGKYRAKLLSLLSGKKQNYVNLMGTVPDEKDWKELKNDPV